LARAKTERAEGRAIAVVLAQLTGSLPDDVQVIIAYEPIWAIGTGLVPSVAEITEVHDALRAQLLTTSGAAGQDISILYGGSVKPSNAKENFRHPQCKWRIGGRGQPQSGRFPSYYAQLSRELKQ
jgi:triosephosphate isomerase